MAEDDIIEIRDPEVDVEEIMARIRRNIERRKAARDAEGVTVPDLTFDWIAERSGEAAPRDELYYNLRQVRQSYDKAWVSLQFIERRIPIPFVGPLLDRLRREAHNLVIFYVNTLAGRQIAFNDYVTRTLEKVVRSLEEREAEGLIQEVRSLREAVERLERKLEGEDRN